MLHLQGAEGIAVMIKEGSSLLAALGLGVALTFAVGCGGAQPPSPDVPGSSTPTAASPTADGDGDGVPDSVDKCPTTKEDGQAPDPKDGCPKS